MIQDDFQSYWSQTGTYESIVPLINMDFNGLKTDVIEMLSGASIGVDVSAFQNDMVSFADKDDVLTLLIHLGYLAYNQKNQYSLSSVLTIAYLSVLLASTMIRGARNINM